MIGLKQKFIGYAIQTFGAGILSLIFIKIFYSLGLANGLCWTTECEIESKGVIMIFYGTIAFVNLYLIFLPWSNKYPVHLSILILTLIIQIYSSTQGNNFSFSTIFYGLMGILNYQLIVKNLILKVWTTLVGGFIMLLIIGINYLNLKDILIGYHGVQFNPNNEEVIKLTINIFTIGLIFQLIKFIIYKIKTTFNLVFFILFTELIRKHFDYRLIRISE